MYIKVLTKVMLDFFFSSLSQLEGLASLIYDLIPYRFFLISSLIHTLISFHGGQAYFEFALNICAYTSILYSNLLFIFYKCIGL